MSGADIAAEVNAALAEVAIDVGDGTFTVTLVTPAEQPVNPWDAPADDAGAVVLNALVSDYPLSQIDGTLIRREDKKFLLPATGPRPAMNCKIIADKTYAIVSIGDVAYSGVSLYYEVQGRA